MAPQLNIERQELIKLSVVCIEVATETLRVKYRSSGGFYYETCCRIYDAPRVIPFVDESQSVECMMQMLRRVFRPPWDWHAAVRNSLADAKAQSDCNRGNVMGELHEDAILFPEQNTAGAANK